jgi:hypothetical protein
MDAEAPNAGWDVVERLGPHAARQLLQILQLHQEARWAAGMALVRRPETVCIGEVLADIEQDPTGQTRKRLIAELHAALDGRPEPVTMRKPPEPEGPNGFLDRSRPRGGGPCRIGDDLLSQVPSTTDRG